MPHFIAIDGLRAWLAWIVAADHVVQQGMPWGGGALWLKLDFGGHAVNTFIIISGFVITHLLLERPVGYVAYIIPRFMRLFPAFLACCTLGALAYAGAARWADPAWFGHVHGEAYRTVIAALPAHVLAHLTMLHGAIPNTVLPLSEYAFLPPGWSVSLEWQFYLLAPFLFRLCRTRTGATILVCAVIACGLLYHGELKQAWDRPSIVIGTAKFFLIGIGCRLAAPKLAGMVGYLSATSLGLAFTLLWVGSVPVALWVLVLCFMLRKDQQPAGIDGAYVRLVRGLLESRPVLLLGERSYSTYLLHWPVIILVGTVASASGFHLGPMITAMMMLALPLTLLLQEPLYRYVEVPGRAFGKRMAKASGVRRDAEVRQEMFQV